MKQIIQNYSTGELQLVEVPFPALKRGNLLIETKASLVSIGTEKAMIDIAKKSLLGKALARPDWVKQVIDKIKTEGLMEAVRQSKARLDVPVPLGYSCAGVVADSGLIDTEDREFKVGDRVACSGSGYASHSEYNIVPPNLCVKIPKNVSFEEASYVALGGIAMEAIRIANIELGFRVGVIGLGLIGQIAVQILKAAGCHVFGVDISENKCRLALEHGAEMVAQVGKDDPVALSKEFSDYEGLDAVIILASVESDEPLIQAAEMCRERGRIIASGLVGLNIPRDLFYKKELDFAVSRAWGPGMYDPDFEERNIKYPLPYVRWTAKRNMEEFLRMVSSGSIRLNKLTTHRFPFERALDAYSMILSGKEPAIGVILNYEKAQGSESNGLITKKLKIEHRRCEKKEKGKIGIGLIGAGLYTRGTLMPALKTIDDIELIGVASAHGLTAKSLADSYNFRYSTSDYKMILEDESIDLVFILTRHNSHSKFICEALKAGKAVFVEKPLCINKEQLREIIDVYFSVLKERSSSPFLMVGFNRRFAPATKQCLEFIKSDVKKSVVQIRCNAGYIPPESWVHKINEGGGRIVGEVCHFVDLAQAITGGLPIKVFASCMESYGGLRDNLVASLTMDNGSVSGITYASNGDKSFSREEVQIFSGGSICIIDNFKNVTLVSAGKKSVKRSLEVDRGHKEELKATIQSLRDGRDPPIDFKSIVVTTLTTFAIEESITYGKAVDINLKEWGLE